MPSRPAESSREGLNVQLLALTAIDVVSIGHVPDSILETLECQVEGNTEVVITGERAAHIRSSHPEIGSMMGAIREVVLDPDQVHRNKKDRQMAVFYRALDDDHYLRVAVLIQPAGGRLAHSVITARVAYKAEVARGEGRAAWRRREASPGGTTNPSWP